MSRLFDLLADTDVSEAAARSLGEIGKTDLVVLTKQNHAVVRVSPNLRLSVSAEMTATLS